MTSSRRFRPARALLGLPAAAVPAAVAVALRSHYDWEDRDAVANLVVYHIVLMRTTPDYS